jgi:hypothetical protein
MDTLWWADAGALERAIATALAVAVTVAAAVRRLMV